MRILLIEDEPAIASVLKRGLEEARYDVVWAPDGDRGLVLAVDGGFSLIILDLMLPGVDGWEICTRLRARRDATPVLMVTARDAVRERVRGLDLGADDYLTKPFDFDELLARVRALLRRDRVHKAKIIRIADLEIDTGAHLVRRAGKPIALTPREYELLEALASHQGRVLTRSVIQEQVWLDTDSYSNTVDVYIGLLRKKVDADHRVKLIHTVHGMGYTLRVPGKAQS